MYSNSPVPIPKARGKITIRKHNGSEYIQYETGRTYDPARKYNIPERKIIGIRIPSLPEMMLPNENYPLYFKGEAQMNEEQKQRARAYGHSRTMFAVYRELFDRMYYEFQIQSRRKPDAKVNAYKAQKIDSILTPLREMMSGEAYAPYLDLIGEAADESGDGGKTYSDVALMLTQYKGAMARFISERM